MSNISEKIGSLTAHIDILKKQSENSQSIQKDTYETVVWMKSYLQEINKRSVNNESSARRANERIDWWDRVKWVGLGIIGAVTFFFELLWSNVL